MLLFETHLIWTVLRSYTIGLMRLFCKMNSLKWWCWNGLIKPFFENGFFFPLHVIWNGLNCWMCDNNPFCVCVYFYPRPPNAEWMSQCRKSCKMASFLHWISNCSSTKWAASLFLSFHLYRLCALRSRFQSFGSYFISSKW